MTGQMPYVVFNEGGPVPAGVYVGWAELRDRLLRAGVERDVIDNIDLALLDPDNKGGLGVYHVGGSEGGS